MKIRNGFVTNSSSSSFILAFENEDSILKELKTENTCGYFETIYKDVMKAERYSKEKMLEEYRNDIYYEVKWELRSSLEYRNCMSFSEALEFSKTDKFKQWVQEEIQNRVNKLSKDMEGKSVFIMVEYDDHLNGELEHKIMPDLSCCLVRISHH